MGFTEMNFLEFTGLLTLKMGKVDSQMSLPPNTQNLGGEPTLLYYNSRVSVLPQISD